MKKFLCIFAAMLLLVLSLFSCKKKTEDKNGESVAPKYDEGTIFYERSLVEDDLPEKDFGGRPFRIVTYVRDEIFIPEEEHNKGNLIYDAKFSRNQVVEDRFKAKLELVYYNTVPSETAAYARKSILSGNDEFDLYVGMAIESGKLITQGLFLNWYDIEHVNFEKPWWVASNSTDLTYDGKCLLAISDFNFSSITSTFCMVFNKNLAAAYELGDIYGMVLDGEWTFDALHECVKDIYEDDGNDVRDEGDFYGLAHGNGSCVSTYLWAFDNPVCKKDQNGVPQIVIKTDKINNIVSDIYDMFYNTNGVHFDGSLINLESIAMDLFLARKAIFTTVTLSAPLKESLRNFEDDYGLIPYPKYDVSQENYYTNADGGHTVLAVPKTVRDTEFVGIMVEALSAETWKTVTPTLYEIALKSRYLRDEESKEVLDLIINGRVYDFGFIYDGWKGFSFTLETLMKKGNNNFESYYESKISSAKSQYKKIIKALDKID